MGHTKLKKFILFLGDAAILFFSLYLTLLLRYGSHFSLDLWKMHLGPFSLLYILWLIIFYISNLYSLTEARVSFDFYQKLLTTLLICGIFSIAYFYLLPQSSITPKTNLFLNMLILAILFSIWRNLFNVIIKSTTKDNVVIIGYSELAYNFAKKINRNPQLGYKIIGFAAEKTVAEEDGIKFITIDKLSSFITKNNINTVVINSRDSELAKKLFFYLPFGLNFIFFTNFYESLFVKVPIDEINQAWFIENFMEGSKKNSDRIKRIMEILISIVLGIISLPLIPFIILAIKLNSVGPILFMQTRTGKNGKEFLAIKFRSMVKDSEKNGPQWAAKNDDRVTRVGKFLRKTRLDEIPQLINVLKGDMSLIGPRPERPEFIKILEDKIPFYKQRLLIRPGLTGWAQINFPYGASVEDAMQKLQYDLYYIKHRSLTLDLRIILKTIAIVLGLKGQ